MGIAPRGNGRHFHRLIWSCGQPFRERKLARAPIRTGFCGRKGVSTEFGAVFRPTGGESAPTREIGVPARVEEIMIAVAGLVEDPGRFLSGGRTEYFDLVLSTARDSGQWSGGGGSAGRAGSAGNGGSAGRAGGRWSSA